MRRMEESTNVVWDVCFNKLFNIKLVSNDHEVLSQKEEYSVSKKVEEESDTVTLCTCARTSDVEETGRS